MYHALAPRYLSSRIPNQVGNITSYNLWNSSNLRNISWRSQLLSKSFLPSTINSWNSVTDEVRSAPSLNSFNNLLSRGRKDVPLFYYEGDSQTCVYHARLCTHCRNLNEHLFTKTLSRVPFVPVVILKTLATSSFLAPFTWDPALNYTISYLPIDHWLSHCFCLGRHV